MTLHCVPIPDCSKPPPGLFPYPPPAGGFHQSPGQESDSLFSEGSSMSSSRHREDGPSHWDQGSDSAKGSTPFIEDQESNWKTSYQAGAPPTFWIPPEPSTFPHPYGTNPELISTTPCRVAQDEVEDWADNDSVFDWDQYRLTEEEALDVVARTGGRNSGDVVENDCKDVVDMEICSVVSDDNNDGERKSNCCARPTSQEKEEDAFSESDRLTDSQMLSLLRHLSATNKNNSTNKHICHTIELFLTLLPVQLQTDTVELRKSSMSSTQSQIFDLLHSKAPWVVDEQIIRSMDLLPFILKRILTSMELQQQAPPTSTDQTPPHKSESCSDKLHRKRQSPVHRRKRRRHHSPRRSWSPSDRRRGRDRSRSPPRYLTSHRDLSSPPPQPRVRVNSLTSLTAVPKSPPKKKVFQFEGRGRNIFTRSPEPPPKTTTDCPRTSSRHVEGRPDRVNPRVKATVRLPHITAGDEEEEQSTEAKAVKGSERKVTNESKQPTKLLTLSFNPMQMKMVAAKCKKSRLESIKRRNRQTLSTAMRWKKRTNQMKKRMANTKAPSLMTLSIPPMSVLRQTGKPTAMKKPIRRRKPPSLLTVKVPLLAPQPSRINPMLFASPAHVTPLTFEPMAMSHRGLLPDPGSQEHLMIIGMKTVSRLGLQSKFC